MSDVKIKKNRYIINEKLEKNYQKFI